MRISLMSAILVAACLSIARTSTARDPAVDGSWSHPELGAHPPGRSGYALVYDSIRHRAVLFGGIGQDGDRTYHEVWTLDLDEPERWERLPVGFPAGGGFGGAGLPRADVLAAFDPRHDRLWVWGGRNHTGAILGDPCFLQFTSAPGDTAAWHDAVPELEPDTGRRPGPRRAAGCAWDETGRRLIFHGGATASSAGIGTWALALDDPPTWQSFPGRSPFPNGAVRANLHVDAATDRLIAHGAVDVEGFWSPEIWTLPLNESGAWAQLRQSGEDQLVRVPVKSVLDRRGRRLIAMKSGVTGAHGDTEPGVGAWALDLDTGAWTKLDPGGSAPPPDGVNLLWDAAHDRLVAVRDQPGRPLDTWFLTWTRDPKDEPAGAPATVWRIGPARPTAGGDGIEIPFRLTGATRVVGVVHDLQGRLIRRLDEARLPSGSWTFVWDGRDEAGASVPPGQYDITMTRLDTGAVGKLRVARER
jgi:hypothetical protein